MAIVRMKKITLLCRTKDENSILSILQETALMHIVSSDIKNKIFRKQSLLKNEINKLKTSINILNNVVIKSAIKKNIKGTLNDNINFILDSHKQKNSLLNQLKEINDKIKKFYPWGFFNVDDITFLKNHNINIKFFILDTKEWEQINKKNLIFSVINKNNSYVYVVIFNSDNLKINSVILPNISLKSLCDMRKKLINTIKTIERRISSFIVIKKDIYVQLDKCLNQEQLEIVQSKSFRDKDVIMINGFIPADKECNFCEKFNEKVIAIHVSDPIVTENVPVKLKNNSFFHGFETILHSFSGISYREKDITCIIGSLFIIFASLCLLDAGYGVLLLLTGLILRYKLNKNIANVFAITGIFSSVFGVFVGQIFGLIIGKDFFLNMTPFISIAIEPIDCFVFSLIIGLCAMGLSYFVAIYQNGICTSALGSLFLVFSISIFLINNFVILDLITFLNNIKINYINFVIIKEILNVLEMFFLVLTILFWFIFPEKIFVNSRIPNILWTLYAGVTGLLQDILSHMRLFGISLSGAILALVVNKIASMFPFFIMILFLFIGHVFVFLLALLSLYIHTNRLIFLEFGSKCITGGHYMYSPFCRSFFNEKI